MRRRCWKSICMLLIAGGLGILFGSLMTSPRSLPGNHWIRDSSSAWGKGSSMPRNHNQSSPYTDVSKQCSKMNNIAFLKVHKSGSTTVANILQRYAIRNQLNIVLPNKKRGSYGFNYLGYNGNFTMESVIPIPRNETYNILCNHVIYNRTMFKKLIPKDSFYLAIVREPEERFVSAAFYYGLVGKLKKTVPGINSTKYIFSEWLKNPWKYGVSMEVYNHVAYDFGLPRQSFHNRSVVDAYVSSLDSDFDFVLLMDYFDESLMLLRRRLCWSMKDMIYLRSNPGTNKVDFAFSEDDRKRLKKWQMADVAIFEHFHARFWRQVEAERRGLFLETAFFKQALRRVSDFCKYGKWRWPSVDIASSPWSESFTVTLYDCHEMEARELIVVQRLQRSAWARYNASLTITPEPKIHN
ncbi:galactose-3-O-sulfotransferase 2-like [Haliotis rufescens]|uniref:galactose-3-O-sulfotransferase 2-like n=1 Tax=Haliotis rufescens TaxID=6454 RepID=UPI00201EB12D|nr:galactose-3-O-sulfotransferase 2-like [Haliotis rufescens]